MEELQTLAIYGKYEGFMIKYKGVSYYMSYFAFMQFGNYGGILMEKTDITL